MTAHHRAKKESGLQPAAPELQPSWYQQTRHKRAEAQGTGWQDVGSSAACCRQPGLPTRREEVGQRRQAHACKALFLKPALHHMDATAERDGAAGAASAGAAAAPEPQAGVEQREQNHDEQKAQDDRLFTLPGLEGQVRRRRRRRCCLCCLLACRPHRPTALDSCSSPLPTCCSGSWRSS